MVLSPEREPRCFQIGQSSIFEAANEHGRVIDSDLAHFLGRLAAETLPFAALIHDGPFLDESVHEAADLFEFSDQIAPQINNVRIDIAVCATAADAFLQSPRQRDTMR